MMINTIDTLTQLAKEIQNADWHYEHSDDYTVYSRGLAQCAGLIKKITKMSFDVDDISYLKLQIIEMSLNPKWTEDFIKEYTEYWEKKIDALTGNI